MWNARLEEAQAGNKIARRNINNLRYADDTTLMAESEEELKSLLMKVKESEKVGLKLNFQKIKMMASHPITSWQIDGETVADFIFGGSKITTCSDFGAQKNKVWHCFHCFPIYFHEVVGPDAMTFVFWMLSFKPTFSLQRNAMLC